MVLCLANFYYYVYGRYIKNHFFCHNSAGCCRILHEDAIGHPRSTEHIFGFPNVVLALASGGFRIISNTLVLLRSLWAEVLSSFGAVF